MENHVAAEQSPFKIEIEDAWEKFKNAAGKPTYQLLFFFFVISAVASSYILFFWNAQSNVSHTPANFALPAAKPTEVAETVPTIVSPTPPATVSANLTTNWKTYMNAISGYTIKFPTDWIASQSASRDPLITDYAIFYPASASATTAISISATTRTNAQLLAIYGNGGTTLTLASRSATEYDQKDSDGNQTISIVMYNTPKSYVFYAMQQYRTILLQMVNTFTPIKAL